MAKGQQRSSKEKKKPKQSKKPGVPAVPFGTDKSKTPPATTARLARRPGGGAEGVAMPSVKSSAVGSTA
jgi:hypothetical protein